MYNLLHICRQGKQLCQVALMTRYDSRIPLDYNLDWAEQRVHFDLSGTCTDKEVGKLYCKRSFFKSMGVG